MARNFGEASMPLFASKSLSFKEIYRVMAEEGIGTDIVSSGELFTAVCAGFPMERAFFHGNNKTDFDIEYAIANDALQAEFKAANVVKMRADWTNKDATIASELRKYGRAAVPVNVFLKKDKAPVILGELFASPGTVSAGLEEIKE